MKVRKEGNAMEHEKKENCMKVLKLWPNELKVKQNTQKRLSYPLHPSHACILPLFGTYEVKLYP